MKKIPKRFFKNKRLEIGRILIDELTHWKSTTTPTEEEFCRLVDRLFEMATAWINGGMKNTQ